MKQLAVARAIEWEAEPYPENIPDDDGYFRVINSQGSVGSARWSVFKDGWVEIEFSGYEPDNEVLFFSTLITPPGAPPGIW